MEISGKGNNGFAPLNPSQTQYHHRQQLVISKPVIDVPLDPDPISVSILDLGKPSSSPVASGSTNPRTSTTNKSIILYRECLRNHAASIGGHVIDGCGEFMPSGEALKCAACHCHRNFHRREINGELQSGPKFYNYRGNRVSPLPIQQYPKFQLGFRPTSQPLRQIQPIKMVFNGGTTDSSSEEELNVCVQSNGIGVRQQPPQLKKFCGLKKRSRTKFSQEQKEKMLEFAEKIGWRIGKQDEGEINQFCVKLGVDRHVLKVWMHNNKYAMKKKEYIHHHLEF